MQLKTYSNICVMYQVFFSKKYHANYGYKIVGAFIKQINLILY